MWKKSKLPSVRYWQIDMGCCRLLSRYLLLLLLLPLPVQADSLSAYTPTYQTVAELGGDRQIMLRSFTRDGVAEALLVNPWTLETKITPVDLLKILPPTARADSPYERALATATTVPARLQNHGIIQAAKPVHGQFLTVDLCPSKRPFETTFFNTVANLGQSRPVPVAVAITGGWLATHGQEFTWLREQERSGRLAITWINHSLTHPYDATVPLSQTFLLTPGLDRRREILALEMQLLEQGVVPSVFFRFPGLVADDAALGLVRELGLIPLGSNAWLAKGETVRDGSIILVHGNGNEPAGIRRFNDLSGQSYALHLLQLSRVITGNAELGKD
jgi:hypothetical protein